ncbi:hypothetical protein AVEN_77241-1, partial [Araneus ventricosus]
ALTKPEISENMENEPPFIPTITKTPGS